MTIITNPEDYRAADAISFSKLRVFERCPLLYRKLYVDRSIPQQDDETKAKRVGSATHCMILEGPVVFSSRYAIKPETYANDKGETKDWNANAAVCRAWEENQRTLGRTVISRSEGELLTRMREAVRTNEDACHLLSVGQPELAIRREYPSLGLTLQGRLDWWRDDGVVVDLKTIECLDDLPAEIERREYYRQISFYTALAGEEFGATEVRGAIIGVEKAEPYRCGVLYLSPELLAIGATYNLASLANLRHAYLTGSWGGNPETKTLHPSADLLFREMEREVNADA